MGGCASKPRSLDGSSPTENPSAPELLSKSVALSPPPPPPPPPEVKAVEAEPETLVSRESQEKAVEAEPETIVASQEIKERVEEPKILASEESKVEDPSHEKEVGVESAAEPKLEDVDSHELEGKVVEEVKLGTPDLQESKVEEISVLEITIEKAEETESKEEEPKQETPDLQESKVEDDLPVTTKATVQATAVEAKLIKNEDEAKEIKKAEEIVAST